ncbi:MAG: phosphatidylserine decarboxylase [Gammaproteobacteria bacterium]|nr:MAG: phosphatidylserine decarboxylase [Gammaproteobacteria bacterium]HDN69169.1 phosphatidylserine decarboxylase [Gammaproteobacteria bacterium]
MSTSPASLLDLLKSWPLAMLPHQLLSRLVRMATRWQIGWWKTPLIKVFIRHFKVDMADAEASTAADYSSFNHFFTRALKVTARPYPDDLQAITSPVDGRVSQAGLITDERLLQAKGLDYSLLSLLGGNAEQLALFRNGKFATIYLSPRDYHRIHMPCQGRLLETTYVPGRLFSVAPHTTRAIPGLFTRNERLVCLFDTPAGPMAMILVGAIFVSCMETVWSGVVNPKLGMSLQSRTFAQAGNESVELQRGDEMGRFNMGSTVILLYGPDAVSWADCMEAGQPLRLGEIIAHPGTLST